MNGLIAFSLLGATVGLLGVLIAELIEWSGRKRRKR